MNTEIRYRVFLICWLYMLGLLTLLTGVEAPHGASGPTFIKFARRLGRKAAAAASSRREAKKPEANFPADFLAHKYKINALGERFAYS